MAEHAFEPELDQPLPRPVRRRGGLMAGCGLWFLRIFILPHTLVGVGVLVAAPAYSFLTLGVWLLGEEVQGRVVRTTHSQNKKKNTTTYTLHYVFTVDGTEYSGQTGVSAQEQAMYKEGTPVPLRVLTVLPHYGHWPLVGNYSPLGQVGGLWFMALFWNGILSIFLWMAYYRPWYHWHLVRNGTPTSGLVRETKTHHGKGGPSYTVRYEYAVLIGEVSDNLLTGSVNTHRAIGTAFMIGDVLTILYDPAKPKRSVPYVLADFEVKTVTPSA